MKITDLKKEIIGDRTFFNTPFGERHITYGDFTASGKSLKFIEKYLLDIQKMYANSHTEDSVTGMHMTELVHAAEMKIKRLLNAKNHYVFSVGTGATGAIQKLGAILGIYYPPEFKKFVEFRKEEIKDRPVVFITAYEHHSNELMWRESIAEVVVIGLNKDGEFDLNDLESKLKNPVYENRMKIGSFSAASNITGIKSPVNEIAKLMHKYGGYACFDFAASGPYVAIDMCQSDDEYFDAIYLSPHKFIGGPSASGLLVLHKQLYKDGQPPTVAGGGTVDYVSSFGYDFVNNVEERERAGTPGILQIIRTALALELKEEIGIDKIENIEAMHTKNAMAMLTKNENIEILGSTDPNKRIGIISFNIKCHGKYLHHRFTARLLNDLFGIQTRAGCACAGPYGHELLHIEKQKSLAYREIIKDGVQALKPGWVRVNFHYTMTTEEVNFICSAINFIADKGYLFLSKYSMDIITGLWEPISGQISYEMIEHFGIAAAIKNAEKWDFEEREIDRTYYQKKYMEEAEKIAASLESQTIQYTKFANEKLDRQRWYVMSHLEKR